MKRLLILVAMLSICTSALAEYESRDQPIRNIMGVQTPTPFNKSTGRKSAFPNTMTGHDHNSGENSMPVVRREYEPDVYNGYNVIRKRTQSFPKETNPGDNTGSFRMTCLFSHMSNDDPIVWPRQKGRAHHHTFFGNANTDANSTNVSLATTGSSTCNGGIANRSGYWIPSMIDTATGIPIKPAYGIFYYKTGNAGAVTIPPAGLRMIAGSAQATVDQEDRIVRFTCNDDIDSLAAYNGRKQHIVDCPSGGDMLYRLEFPSCWNGVDMDSPNHQSHMAYSNNGVCPSTHPVIIPVITYNIHYKVPIGGSTVNWRLSSDNYSLSQRGGTSAHGDWMNGWNLTEFAIWFNNCLKTIDDCHGDLLGDGTEYY